VKSGGYEILKDYRQTDSVNEPVQLKALPGEDGTVKPYRKFIKYFDWLNLGVG